MIRAALAANPSTPADILVELAATGDESVQLALAGQRATRPHAVEVILAQSPHLRVRRQLAEAVTVADDVLLTLAQDPQWTVRVSLIERPRPDAVYALLVEDKNEIVQAELLNSPTVPDRVKRELGRHNDLALLRYGDEDEAHAAYLRMLPRSVSESRFRPPLSLLADPQNRLAAIERIPLTPDLARDLATDPDNSVRRAVAANPDLPRDLQELLATDPDPEVRKRLAYRPFIAFDLLERLDYGADETAYRMDWLEENRALIGDYFRSRQLAYRRAIARMSDLPQEIVDHLSRDEDYKVRVFLAVHNGSRAPLEILEGAFLTWTGHSSYAIATNPRIPATLIDRLIHSPNVQDRWRASHSPHLTEAHRTLLAADPDPTLAANFQPPPTADDLKDPDPIVRAKAARNPALPEPLIRSLWATLSEPHTAL